jgi:hypothetical protein
MSDNLPVKRGDLKRYEQALRQNWSIPDAIFKALPGVMAKILKDGSNREKVAAARVLAALHSQNQATQPRLSMVAHKHQHEVLPPINPENLNERRAELRARAARLR